MTDNDDITGEPWDTAIPWMDWLFFYFIGENMDRFNSAEEIRWLPKEFGEGAWDRKSHKPMASNHYPEGTLKYKSYNAGWCDADMQLQGDLSK